MKSTAFEIRQPCSAIMFSYEQLRCSQGATRKLLRRLILSPRSTRLARAYACVALSCSSTLNAVSTLVPYQQDNSLYQHDSPSVETQVFCVGDRLKQRPGQRRLSCLNCWKEQIKPSSRVSSMASRRERTAKAMPLY